MKTLLTDSVRKICFGVSRNIALDVYPKSFFSSDFLAMHTNRDQPAKCLHLGKLPGQLLIRLPDRLEHVANQDRLRPVACKLNETAH